MSIFFRPRGEPQERALSYQDVWGSGGNTQRLGGDPALAGLTLIPVYAATSLICDMIATSPLAMFNKSPDGALRLMDKQPQLVANPSPYGTVIDWVHQAIASMLLRGNAYGYVTQLGSDGWPSQIIWLDPNAMAVVEEQTDWFHTPKYYWRGRELNNDLVVHIPAYTMAGSVLGLSPLALFKLQIETGNQAQRFANDWFANNANPSGILRNTAKTLDPVETAAVRAKYKAAIANRDVFVTGNDWEYAALTVQPEESQFLQTIKATATQIAAVYRVSPDDIGGEVGSSMTYKTLTQDSTRLITRALNPWAQRLALAITNLRPRPQSAAFNLSQIAEGDHATRIATHAAAINSGQETLDEARAAEGKDPLTPEELADFRKNYGKGGSPAPPPAAPSDPAPSDPAATDPAPTDPAPTDSETGA